MSTPFTTRKHNSALRSRRQAFTLIEILVVLSIAAVVTAITLGGFNEMRSGNKRTSCQTNLVQIYQAARLYASDEGGKFPYYGNALSADKEVDCSTMNKTVGIGLWSLFTFPAKTDLNSDGIVGNDLPTVGTAPIERYIRSSRVLHCTNHFQHRELYSDAAHTTYDENYLSYQWCDDGSKNPNAPFTTGTASYSSTRTNTASDTDWKRQLLHYSGSSFVTRPPADTTVITWCPFHRNSRDMDNVLFYDGSVQLIARVYNSKTTWQRDPKLPN